LNRHWSQVSPHWLTEIDHQHKRNINVWCTIIGSRIDPIFFQETLSADKYSTLIDLSILLETLPLRLRLGMWFQQYGCPSHTPRVARTVLNTTFPNKWIGKYGPIKYSLQCPDLTILDYYL